jgi:hypothetical protein
MDCPHSIRRPYTYPGRSKYYTSNLYVVRGNGNFEAIN